MQKKYQIPLNLCNVILQDRTVRILPTKDEKDKGTKGKYAVNKHINPIITFCKLKSLTHSGYIQRTEKETKGQFLGRIAKAVDISHNVLLSHINFFKASRLIYFNGQTITLSSWQKITQHYGYEYIGNHQLTALNSSVVYALSDLETEHYCRKAYRYKTETLCSLGVFDDFTSNVSSFTCDHHNKIQLKLFKENRRNVGIYMSNPRFERSIKKRREECNLRSNQSVYYWLNKMHNNESAHVSVAFRVYSEKNGTMPNNFRGYCEKKQKSFFTVPTGVQINEAIFFHSPKTKI